MAIVGCPAASPGDEVADDGAAIGVDVDVETSCRPGLGALSTDDDDDGVGVLDVISDAFDAC